MDEKRRTITLIGPQSYTSKSPISELVTSVSPSVTYEQSTVTRGHSWPSAKGVKTDLGGNFTTNGIISIDSSDLSSYKGAGAGYEYTGREYAVDPRAELILARSYVVPSSDASLMVQGTTAIARCLPTNPVADAGTFIGELKSGLPKLIGKELFKTKLKDYRKVGSEYINVEFGWKPIISDLQKFGTAAIESNKIISQLHRDSGRNIRRRFTFPDVVTSTSTSQANRQSWTMSGGSGYPATHWVTAGGPLATTTEVVTKTWFSGCFTYHVFLGNTIPERLSRQAAEARKLFGIELTPETVWNLAPWSWALDWEGNIGDALHNISRFSQDGLVMRYGYIMQQKSVVIKRTLAYQGRLKGAPRTNLTMTTTAYSKVRRRATPFGFGFNMESLNGRQLSILGALGIARGPRHL